MSLRLDMERGRNSNAKVAVKNLATRGGKSFLFLEWERIFLLDLLRPSHFPPAFVLNPAMWKIDPKKE